MKSRTDLQLGFTSRHAWKNRNFFAALAQKTLEHMHIAGQVYLDVALVDRAMIRALNRRYRHRDQVTDVISFALEEGLSALAHDFNGRHLGDIFLCYSVIAAQARQLHHPVDRELAFIFVHGLLHLLGYDHQDDSSEQQMNTLTYQLIAQCGYEKTHQTSG